MLNLLIGIFYARLTYLVFTPFNFLNAMGVEFILNVLTQGLHMIQINILLYEIQINI